MQEFSECLVKLLEKRRVQISKDWLDFLNSLTLHLVNKYIQASITLCHCSKKVTIDAACIETVTRLWIGDHRNIEFCHQVWNRYAKNNTKGLKKHIRAKLCLHPAKIKKLFLKQIPKEQKLGEQAYVILAATIEFILDDLLTAVDSDISQLGPIMSNPQNRYYYIFQDLFIVGLPTKDI
jgi:hypothetical protein